MVLFLDGIYAQQTNNGSVNISINAVSGMQFDIVRFSVKPGVKVRIAFTNADDMSHNFLITKPGARLDVVNEALKLEEKGPMMNYIPKSASVLWSIPVVSANQSAAVEFTSPTEPGAYPYVCTFPGHGFIMYGVMYVSNNNTMPDLKTDPNIPPARREDKTAAVAATPSHDAKGHNIDHPYDNIPPFLYRIFMDDSGPASIAVSLPKDLSYCWDAGSCQLRYAWSGGFLDNTAIWKGHVDANAKILGIIFYRESWEHPLVIGNPNENQVVEFKGYSLINKFPEFHYTVNGNDVYELITPKEDGKGLVRSFRIPNARGTVWFLSRSVNGSVVYESTAGDWVEKKLKLMPEQARKFSVTMTNYSLVFNTRKKK
ncbi:MAG: hypothetical protein H7069_12305 [Phormidesmis sp. FL-bin-119]|nr:hypothetical protein [Pedobacter sp.]